MKLSKIEFIADWQRVMGSDTALSTDTVLEYINLRAQADARPVARWRRNAQGGIDFTVIGDPYVVDEAELFTHPAEASAPGLSESAAALAKIVHTMLNTFWDASTPEQRKALFKDGQRALVGYHNLTRASAATASPDARIEELRKGLFEARDAMRVMANWVKLSDPAGHSWAVRMVDRANAVLSGASAATVAEPSGAIDRIRRLCCDEAGSTITITKVDARSLIGKIDALNAKATMAAQQQAEPGADERKAFEHWASDGGDFPAAVERAVHGGYKLAQTQSYWVAWQARAAQSGQRAGVAELSSKKIEAGWHATFSTNNPFCPCDLKSFTKAVRWAERAIAAAPTQQQEGE
ncbi:hypothetical protein LMG18090_04714 [Ralstonia mannitolilytica]|uniref:hypothetical protein n=1 Tax=Ralstonia mannitolilytica TaxID=105219 RepID=UPI000B09B438|nr:hypothetical protein [Ralstonia mannitolilytica]CAJ0804981.1 hypothetical protein LMG18090_04714 [Ralstonia mannitolilytica]